MIKFPSDFFWGAATSSYQVEGDNSNTDWWAWEKKAGKECSGLACKHYELYEQDFDLAKSLHHNAHRLSIEWARIEPKEGQFSLEELKHYTDVILALKKRGIEPMVTLHHFTNPLWLSDMGGWENKKVIELFRRYSEFVVKALAQHVRYWMTINEPTIISSHGYVFGYWPPQVKSVPRVLKVQEHQIAAHVQSYRVIHQVYEQQGRAQPIVGIAHHMPAIVTCKDNFRNRIAMTLRNWCFNTWFIDRIRAKNALDFIGLNYYSRHMVDTNSWGLTNMFSGVCGDGHNPRSKNSLNWDIYPEGLYQVLMSLKKYNLPVMITENGICTLDDHQRWEFIRAHLKSIHEALSKGVDIRGYLYWSLLDNFEWDKGYAPRFGLIEVDYQTFQRTIKPSARKLAEVYQSNSL